MRLTRRDFLIGSAAAAVLAACSDGSSKEATPSSTTASTPTTRRNPALSGDPFGFGVASGDPRPDSVILWARLAPNPKATDGLGGMPAKPVDVTWEVAADERFTKGVARGVATAETDSGHSLHVDAGGLDPTTDYYYRFTVGEWTSPTGRTRTLPAPGDAPNRFALAIANCQMLDTGRFGAYRHMCDEDLDLVVHLGDYIYEYPGPRALPNRQPESLADFRVRYASYRSDQELQAAHARFPFVLTWDDHEVQNNYMSNVAEDGTPPEQFAAVRAAAYRAWWEYLPVRIPAPEGEDVPIYGHTDIGDLARLYVLDTRGHADEPPCRDGGAVGDLGNCDARTAEDRSLLGAQQETWFADATKESRAQWNIVGNPVALSGIDAGTDQSAYSLDCWDGFPQARSRFLGALAATDNPVILTGDYHQGLVFDTHRQPFEQDSEIIATEFLSPPISSVLFSDDVTARTPQVRQQIDAHGYLTVAVEPDCVTTDFRVLDDVANVKSPIRTEASWVVSAGNPRAVKQ
ncbi:MAG TPA: alkaline phosphatase D family protein [Acidimicrobiia bacterium]|nr:alkaline phosphatase D family protein [Acidimicrobiia bacterium]